MKYHKCAHKFLCGILLYFFLILPFAVKAQQLTLKNNLVQRTLRFDGEVWRTISFSTLKGGKTLMVKSDELNILPINSNKTYGIGNFTAVKKPAVYKHGDTSFISITYRPLPTVKGKEAVPDEMNIKYFLVTGAPYIRKIVTLNYNKPATVDRLEIERFVSPKPAKGGGRGEPVFVNGQWFFGLEYPGAYTRHTNGNMPRNYARSYDSVGNYSYINLENRDVEPKPENGLIRLMHFPGNTVQQHSGYCIISKIAVAGVALNQETIQTAFMGYLATLWKAPRSFLHFNNWFEPKAKDLKGDGLINVWRDYRSAISPYGIKLDAMVADDGWQDRKSIWEPSKNYFPNGYADVKALSDQLQNEGVGFGLWLSLNGYTNNIDWGKENGYHEAKLNSYFSKFGRNYSLSASKYKAEVLKKIPEIAKSLNLSYYKHDFNVLSDMADGNNHPATDRHGHEATLNATIEVLEATRKLNPNIHQNMTNWIWFSPWWLMYADYLWMLAGDDGTNGNWPEISTRAMGSTDRDTYIWRIFGKPDDRPLIPISRLMTHGIIKSTTGRMESKEDNLQDWAEYVLMHYGRGTLLKEWYISPQVMKPEDWKVLCRQHNWAKKHLDELTNTVYVGGRPDEGNTYGYVGWSGEKGVLIVRNTSAITQKLTVPFDQSVNFKAAPGQTYHADVVFPYQDSWPVKFTSGKNIEIELEGYATMACKGLLHKNTVMEYSPIWDGRSKEVAYLEAFGRLIAGLAPFLALPDEDTAEGQIRKRLREQTLQSLAHAVDPSSHDYLDWGQMPNTPGQPLVDASYIAQAFLVAPATLWEPLSTVTKQRFIKEFKNLRKVEPPQSNWLLFAAMVETFLLSIGEKIEASRIDYAIEKITSWYVGDGWYSDGKNFHFDHYNGFVIHPMLVHVLRANVKNGRHSQKDCDLAYKRMQRYASFQERYISPEGTYVVVGRSSTYRVGAFQPLTQLALEHALPEDIKPAQVRCALTAVMKKMFVPSTFTKGGLLTLGLVGSQQTNLADYYSNTGSMYITSLVFLPLGLPATDEFWTAPFTEWTQCKAWSGKPFKKDYAVDY
ncbi:DUF2264 domain-containing protein [Pedobacter sp. GSP4]|uniref:DUF2264 domain-containing protein n=1 Tax=Pedobacter sp. GSP4 TaxID=3453716 RepID=UPI003EEEEEA8